MRVIHFAFLTAIVGALTVVAAASGNAKSAPAAQPLTATLSPVTNR